MSRLVPALRRYPRNDRTDLDPYAGLRVTHHSLSYLAELYRQRPEDIKACYPSAFHHPEWGAPGSWRLSPNGQAWVKGYIVANRLRQTWVDMRHRCLNPKRRSFPRYGGRGIRICEEWVNSFDAFESYVLATIGPKPRGKSIDRVDNNGHYEPGNIRWATPREQTLNREKAVYCLRGHELSAENVFVTAKGRRNCRLCARIRDKITRPHRYPEAKARRLRASGREASHL